MAGRPKPTNFDEYLDQCPEPARAKIVELRSIIREASPDAEEVISYSIPAWKFHGWLVYISGYKAHVSISMPPETFESFPGDLSGFKTSKSTVQFPLDRPLPEALIRQLLAHRMEMNLANASKSSSPD